MQAVADAVEVGDIVGCLTSGETKFRSSLRPPRTGRHAELKDKVEYQWKVHSLLTVPVRSSHARASAVYLSALHAALSGGAVCIHFLHSCAGGDNNLVCFLRPRAFPAHR
jgi:hypothetical protein